MSAYERKPFPFSCKGMNLSLPSDRLAPDQYRVLFNTRNFGDGQIQGRQGQVNVTANLPTLVQGTVHTIKRMDDPIPSPSQFPGAFVEHCRLLGVGTDVIMARDATSDPTFYVQLESGFSGDPLSMAIARSDFSPRPFCIIADTAKMRKALSSSQSFQLGIAPPNFTPITVTVVGAPGDVPGGPKVAANGEPYNYRFVARGAGDINTGAQSYPGPPLRDIQSVSPDEQFVTMVVPGATPAQPDTQVAWLDVYRFGGTLPEWIYIGTVTNAGGHVFTDQFADIDIASNPRLGFDLHQPFVTLDVPKSGTCTIALLGQGATVTWASGDQFKPYDAVADQPYWPAGTQIIINGTAYTMYRAPDSALDFELFETPNCGAGGPFTFLIPSPELVHQPMQFLWGPFGGGSTGTFFFAVGDQLRPGALYWTVGNRAEAHTPRNVLDITSPSEPLMNGVMFDGTCYVFSTERMFRVYPSFGQVSDFIAVEVPNAKGLLSPWAIAVGPKLWFLARDGIYQYESTGGEPVSITRDLYPLFPHEGVTLTNNTFTIDGMLNVTFAAPDFDRPNDLRLAYADGFLYFDYVDKGTPQLRRTLVYDTVQRTWISRDTYTHAVVCHYREEGEHANQGHNSVLMGTDTGFLVKYGGYLDIDAAIDGQIRTGARDMDDPRPRKFWGDIQGDFDSNCDEITFRAGFDNFTFFSDLQLTGSLSRGRRRVVFDINTGLGQYAFNIGLDITWTASLGRPIFYLWEPSFIQKPELTVKRVTDWHDEGYAGAKFIQGFILKGDTLGIDRTLDIQSDNGAIQQTFTINHNGESEKPYSFTTPFITHLLREHPTDSDFWRMFSIRYVFEPAPELVGDWITQETTHDLRGYWHHRDGYVATISSGVVTLTITVDGVAFVYPIASGAGLYTKPYTVFQPMKGKYATYSLTSPVGFRLFQKDTEIRVKEWGTPGPYQVRLPFGDLSRTAGARI